VPCGLAGALDAAQRTCNGLTQELAALRDRLSPQDAEAVLLQREENEILRQKIKEMARRSFAPQAAHRGHFGEDVERALDRGYISQKSHGVTRP